MGLIKRKNITCSIARKNQKILILKISVKPRLVLSISEVWKIDMYANIKNTSVKHKFSICITFRFMKFNDASSVFQSNNLQNRR